jgi:hypothetical protein
MPHHKSKRLEMAVADSNDDLRDEDFRAHLDTYERFTALVKYGTVAVVILLILMAFFLV